MKFARITIMSLFVCIIVLVFTPYLRQSNPVGVKLTPLSENEMSSVKGADGFMQHCPTGAGDNSCPGRASCSGVTCVQNMINGFPVGCYTQGGNNGCTGSGNWKDCEWAWCLWCSENGTARCGVVELHACDTTLGGLACTGTCTVWSTSTTCKKDCT